MIPDYQVDPDYLGTVDPYQAAVRRRQQVPQWGPIPQLLALALNRRLHMPEQYPYAPHPRDYVPEHRPYVPDPLAVLGQMLHGLEFGRG